MSKIPEGTSPLALPTGYSTISWKVEVGSVVRTGDVLGYCSSSSGGGASAAGGHSDAAPARASSGGGLIRPKKRARPRPGGMIPNAASGGIAANGGSSSKGGSGAAAAAVAAAPAKKKAGVSLGSLMAGISRTDSTLTGGSAATDNDDDKMGGGEAGSGQSQKNNDTAKSSATSASAASVDQQVPLRAPSDGFLRLFTSTKKEDGDNGDNAVIIGYVEPCHHPAIVGGLCAVCGSKAQASKKQTNMVSGGAQHSPAVSAASANGAASGGRSSTAVASSALHGHSSATTAGGVTKATTATSHLTVSGGLTISISQSEAKSIASDDSARLRSAKKLSLVLDLDHTLLHATADPRAEAYVARSCLLIDDENRRRRREDVRTLVLPMMEAAPAGRGGVSAVTQVNVNDPIPAPLRHFVKLRPHLAKFLTQASQRYELTIYTAGTRSYAHKVAHVISRHIVGAKLDEEDLSNLRRSLSAAEERAKWHEARMKRRRYVEGLNQKFKAGAAAEEEEETQVREDTSMIFDDEVDDEEKDTALKPPDAVADAALAAAIEEKKGEEDEVVIVEGGTESTKADKKGNTAAANVDVKSDARDSSNKKSGGAMTGGRIPRKRKRVSFDPAAKEDKEPSKAKEAAAAAAAAATDEKKAAKEKKTEDENYDQAELEATVKRLRADLGEAERLEKKATELRMKLFGSRIVSRTDVSDLGRDVKSLRRVFPCGGTMAAIIDDREDVWANAENNATGRPGEPPDNLLLIRPYHWKPFSGFADVNNEAGVDMTKAGGDKDNKAESVEDEEWQERQLLWMGDILRRVHERYYSSTVTEEKRDKLSVPGILRELRRNVLGSSPRCKIVLSGLVPLHKQNQIAAGATVRQPRPSIVRYAESLGAKVLPDVTEKTTHVIAARDGTEKTLRARRIPGCAVVRISWLMECWWSITRRELTTTHLIGPPPRPGPPAATGESSKQSAASTANEEGKLLLSGSDSSEDEDLAAEFEMEMMG